MKSALVIAFCVASLLVAQKTTAAYVLQAGEVSTKPPASGTEAMYRAAAASAEAKFHHIETNAQLARPDQTPTVFTEREINAYISSENVKLPNGVSRLQLSGNTGSITANALVDFDKITENRSSSNPLLSLFSGVHHVEVASHGQASGGRALLHIDSVSIDGVRVPRIALQYFADRYIKPKHPNLGLDSQFALPDRIDTANIGAHTLTVTQK